MDMKSAFLYGTIEEEVYVCQPLGFEDPQFSDKLYKVEKALYSLHQAPKAWYETLSTYLIENGFRRGTIDKTKEDGIFISQDKYVAEILKKFDVAIMKTANTPMEHNKALVKDEEAGSVYVHLYRSMIRSLMYLTASRPDITFAGCACARDSPFDLEAFSDSDYDGASLDRKSTTGVFHSKTKHIEIRHHFIRDSYEKKLIQVIKIHKDHNVVDLLIKAFDGTGSSSGPWRQETIGGIQAQTRSEGVSNLSSDPPLSGGHTLGSGEDNMEHQIELTDNVPNTPHDSPLLGVNTSGSDEGSLKLNELMDLVTELSHRVFDLEKVKTAQAKEIVDLKRRVTKLEQRQRSRILKNHPFIFENQGKIGVDDTKVVKGCGDTEVNTAGEGVSTASVPETVSSAALRTPPKTTIVFVDEDVTMAMAQTLIKMKEEKAKEKGVVLKDVEDSSRPIRSITTLQSLPTINPKDKGKCILQEIESIEKTKKKVQGDAQMERDVEVALRLQADWMKNS
ncbi:copia protein [Tanacetum coccineum]